MRYFLADTDINPTDDVFMLMSYSADIGPDTSGMEGDDFYCLGKFYAPSLADAKRNMEAIKNKYPWLKKDAMSSRYTVRDIYVDKYNEYFDQQPEDEDDIDMNPSAWGGVEYNIFSDLDTLIDYLGFNKERSFDYDNMEDELPFDIYDGPTTSHEDYLIDILDEFAEQLELDPNYDVADVRFGILDSGYVTISIAFDDGDVIDNWEEPISAIPLDGDRYEAYNYLMNKFTQIREV